MVFLSFREAFVFSTGRRGHGQEDEDLSQSERTDDGTDPRPGRRRGHVSFVLRICALYLKERKGKEEYLYSSFLHQGTHKVLRHGSHSFTCKQHHVCLSFRGVHQMSPLTTTATEAADIQLQLTIHLSTPKG